MVVQVSANLSPAMIPTMTSSCCLCGNRWEYVLRELRQNGSPEPEFEMDEDRTYLNTIIHIRDGFRK